MLVARPVHIKFWDTGSLRKVWAVRPLLRRIERISGSAGLETASRTLELEGGFLVLVTSDFAS